MLRYFTVLLATILLFASHFAAAIERPECTEWAKQASSIIDMSQKSLTFIQGKKIGDLLSLAKKYPDPIPYDVFSVKDKNETHQQTAERLIATPACKDISFYDVFKRALEDPKTSNSIKKKFLAAIFDRTIQDDDSAPSLITLMIRCRLVSIAIDQQVIKLSDADNYEFSSIIGENEKIKINLRNEDDGVRTNGNFDIILTHITHEYQQTRVNLHRFIRWVKRVQKLK